MKEQGAETAGGGYGCERGEELVDEGGGVAEATEVRDALGGFEGEAEVRGCGGEPAFEHFGCGKRAEGVVDLHGGEAGAVEGEEVFLAQAIGVEARLPGGIGPAGGADEEVWDEGWAAAKEIRELRLRDETMGLGPGQGTLQESIGFARDSGAKRWGLGRLVGFEPTTSAATERRSATEL